MGRVKGSDVARLGCEELIDLVGPAATLPYGADGAIADGAIEYAHRGAQRPRPAVARVEVFRTMIAQHHLGLPRPEYPGRKVFLTGDRPRHGGGLTEEVIVGPIPRPAADRNGRGQRGRG